MVGLIWCQVPVRVQLLAVSEVEHVLVVVVHHIAGDGHSSSVLARDLIGAYGDGWQGWCRWEPLAVQVADVALWEASVLGSVADEGSVLGGELAFWRQRLAGVPELLELPTDFCGRRWRRWWWVGRLILWCPSRWRLGWRGLRVSVR